MSEFVFCYPFTKLFSYFCSKIMFMAEQGLDIQHTENLTGTPDCMILRAEGLVKKYGSYESKLEEILQTTTPEYIITL